MTPTDRLLPTALLARVPGGPDESIKAADTRSWTQMSVPATVPTDAGILRSG